MGMVLLWFWSVVVVGGSSGGDGGLEVGGGSSEWLWWVVLVDGPSSEGVVWLYGQEVGDDVRGEEEGWSEWIQWTVMGGDGMSGSCLARMCGGLVVPVGEEMGLLLVYWVGGVPVCLCSWGLVGVWHLGCWWGPGS